MQSPILSRLWVPSFQVTISTKNFRTACYCASRLINHIRPATILSIERKNIPFVKMSNIGLFLQAAQNLGLKNSELFQTVDLYEAKDMAAVVNTILSLARISGNKHACAKSCPSTKPGRVHIKTIFPSKISTTPSLPEREPLPCQKLSKAIRPTTDSGYSTLSRDADTTSLAAERIQNDDRYVKLLNTNPSDERLPQMASPKPGRHRFSQSALQHGEVNEFAAPVLTPSKSTPTMSLSRPKHDMERKHSDTSIQKQYSNQTNHKVSTLQRQYVRVNVQKGRGSLSRQYQLGNCIGKGQFGSVYRALDIQTGEIVAIKRIKLSEVEDVQEEVMQEVDLLKGMASSSIVQYIAFAHDEEHLNIVLEYVENGSLLSTLKAFGSLPERLVASYTQKILKGLFYLHEHQVAHCDLKAANILTTKTGDVKLTDFGVSLNLHVKQQGESIPAGTPNWMAPEVIELKGATTQSDIWSLGCTVIELFTGKPPYADLISMSALYHIVEDDHPPFPENASELMCDVLRACFQKNPKDRPTAAQLLEHPWIIQHCPVQPPPHRTPALRRKMHQQKLTHEESSIHSSYHSGTDTIDLTILSRYLASEPGVQLPALPDKVQSNGKRHRLVHPHRFIKSHLEKAIKCKLCQTNLRSHALICEVCTLICHDTCQSKSLHCRIPSFTNLPVPPPRTGNRLQKLLGGIHQRMTRSSHADIAIP
ncbi:kinase-like domain-containing protein [Radiomyces spectabilis]|uniref:kinase-like domain-containing protein n=1 Tax=Radiomyces spectabilis TaxID=64574 RepID=UPI00221FDB91|nr:kinase-like domain-containing protein [Radiomyces spectabilis]KAI8374574.1 kinase-like domain-containing protein [Radiomyces spectabilis]